MTEREKIAAVWLPIIRRVARHEWPTNSELRRAFRGTGTVPESMRVYVEGRFAGAIARPAHRPAKRDEARLLPWLWPAIDVRWREAELHMAGKGRHSRGLALRQIAAVLKKPVSPDYLRHKIADLRRVPSLRVLEPSVATCERLMTDPAVQLARAEKAKRAARKGLG